MSYIDCFNHSSVGVLFNSINIYHPMETLDEEVDFLDETNLLIGGGGLGGGEFPSSYLESLDYAVLFYIHTQSVNSDGIDVIDNVEKLENDLHSFDVNNRTNLIHSLSLTELNHLITAIENVKIRECLNIEDCRIKWDNLNVDEKLNFIIGEVVFHITPDLISREIRTKYLDKETGLFKDFYPRFSTDAFTPAAPNWNCYGRLLIEEDVTGNCEVITPIVYYMENHILSEVSEGWSVKTRGYKNERIRSTE